MKFYRWAEYYKWDLLIVVSGLVFFGWIVSCQPVNHTDVKFNEVKRDTINADKGRN